MVKKVVVVSTGGTIAMRYDPELKGVFPAITGSQLLETVPFLGNIFPVEIEEFSNIPSSHMTPAMMFQLSHRINEILADSNVLGVVVTHGTDTLEETAYLLDLTINSQKPICLTGAMRSSSSISPDGPKNFFCAVKTAVSKEARGKGVLVVINEEIHGAQEVTKTHSSNLKTFASPFWGPLGYVDEDRVIFKRSGIKPQKIQPSRLEEDVYLVKLAAGVDDYIFRCLAGKRVKGIVVESLGRGNVPPSAMPGIGLVLGEGIPIVITSRSFGGRVLDIYGYAGGGKPLKEMGAIFGGEISGQKARIKLMLVLGLTQNHQEIASYFDNI